MTIPSANRRVIMVVPCGIALACRAPEACDQGRASGWCSTSSSVNEEVGVDMYFAS
jgi:hypothetical protein